jgi:hypothetical protein
MLEKTCHPRVSDSIIAHDDPAAGYRVIAATKDLVQREYYFENMNKYIEDFVKSCEM